MEQTSWEEQEERIAARRLAWHLGVQGLVFATFIGLLHAIAGGSGRPQPELRFWKALTLAIVPLCSCFAALVTLAPTLTGGRRFRIEVWVRLVRTGPYVVVAAAWAMVFLTGREYLDEGLDPRRGESSSRAGSFDPERIPAGDSIGATLLSRALQAPSRELSALLLTSADLVNRGELMPFQAVQIVKNLTATPGTGTELVQYAGRAGIDLGAEGLRRAFFQAPAETVTWLRRLGEKAADAGIDVTQHGLKSAIDAALRPDPGKDEKEAQVTASFGNGVVVNCLPSARAIPTVASARPPQLGAGGRCECAEEKVVSSSPPAASTRKP